ncbi:MAG: hypothetical protein ACRDZ4_16050 [Egibacteraceae bacterium]
MVSGTPPVPSRPLLLRTDHPIEGVALPHVVRHTKSGKARFDDIYNQPDPRLYFSALRHLEYETPAHAAGVFSRLVAKRREQLDREDLVELDLCCSYGVNAALLNHEVTLDALYERYCSAELAPLSSQDLAATDGVFYRERRRLSPVQVIGIDVAENAAAYARRVGLHVEASSENLETHDPSEALSRVLAGIDLITVTGGMSYISERTFDRVLKHAGTTSGPWVAVFALRWVDYEPIAEALVKYGLTTEKLTGRTFPQRRFIDDAEQNYALSELAGMGIAPDGKETEGRYHTEFYLSRPDDHIRSLPLNEFLAEMC